MFINTLPLFFSQMAYAAPWELMIIFLGMYVVLVMIAPRPEINDAPLSTENYLFSAWIGAANLGWVFWPLFLLVNISVYAADYLANTSSITVSSWDDVHIALLLPIVWWTVGVWRCSAYCSGRMWSAAARLMTIAVVFELVLRLLIRINFPRLYFQCEELLMDYGSCF